jgi:hypothetical protein
MALDLAMSAELAEELATNARPLRDPRHVPVSFSRLKHIGRSPAHYLHNLQHGLDETLSMRIGKGTHALVFGTPEVVVFTGTRRAGTPAKPSPWDLFQREHARKCILNQREHALAVSMARAITSDLIADPLLFAAGTEHELRLEWSFFGRKCSGVLDAIGPSALCDLKVVKEADPKWFGYQVRRMGWHAQVAWYRDGAEAAGLGGREPYLVAIESEAPHVVTVFHLNDADYAAGQRQYRGWFERVLECEASMEWPGYSDGVVELSLDGPRVTETDDDTADSDTSEDGEEAA